MHTHNEDGSFCDSSGCPVWFGIVELWPKSGCEILDRDAGGAFVPLLALADSETAFRRAAEEVAAHYKCRVIEVGEIERFEEKAKRQDVPNALIHKVREVIETGYPRMGTFQIYPLDELPEEEIRERLNM